MLSLENIWKKVRYSRLAGMVMRFPRLASIALFTVIILIIVICAATSRRNAREGAKPDEPGVGEIVSIADMPACYEEGYVEHGDTGIVDFVSSVAGKSGNIVEFVNEDYRRPSGTVDFVSSVSEYIERKAAADVVTLAGDYEYKEAVSRNTLILTTMDLLSYNYHSTGETLIMGSTGVSLEQMVAYYLDKGGKYPDYYANTDAPTIEDFCRIYIEECIAEGVRYDIAFCQAMKETGFLHYGGSVSISQFNFAGMGASGNGAHGLSYGSVHEGIRAHVQHLKAFASTADMVNPPVDNRWSKVRRGSAVYVEYLGINENPKHTGWATAARYGYSLMDDYVAVLATY